MSFNSYLGKLFSIDTSFVKLIGRRGNKVMSYRSWHVMVKGILKGNYKDFIFLLLLLFGVGFLLFISIKTEAPNMAFDNEEVGIIEGEWTVKT
ncbi:MAG: hypothetical protein HGA25_10235, partial [Clostridiales bacterium]|nr:hypothetical protein [Clostridiales bacterium]